jgi:hypothetical protein
MAPGKDQEIMTLVLLAILGLVIYRVVLWVMGANRTVNPWGGEVDAALDQDDAVPLCNHCLAPQQHNGWFCPECGATVGPYCNYLPYIYIFSQGEVLRSGVTERLRRTPLIVIGYILFSLGVYAIAAPIYWIFLFKNLRRGDDTETEVAGLEG